MELRLDSLNFKLYIVEFITIIETKKRFAFGTYYVL